MQVWLQRKSTLPTPVRYAVLVKIHQWPEKKKKKQDPQEETVAAAANGEKGKRKASHLKEAEDIAATKRFKSSDVASELEELEVEYDYEEIAEGAYVASDSEPENGGDEDEEAARCRKYKFKSVEVSVFMAESSTSVIKVIDRMEVWPNMPEYTWEFTWSDTYTNRNNDKADSINTISFNFLNRLFESDDMLRNPTVCPHEWDEGESFSMLDIISHSSNDDQHTASSPKDDKSKDKTYRGTKTGPDGTSGQRSPPTYGRRAARAEPPAIPVLCLYLSLGSQGYNIINSAFGQRGDRVVCFSLTSTAYMKYYDIFGICAYAFAARPSVHQSQKY
ncbi:hypothetical protein K440DRAFT_680228 [Wilcoxina mikolae CBS 423.85]|nr:hypothetical protein K440DRAFT_680228 [Wilcoxina mikolae CBS 423.85]